MMTWAGVVRRALGIMALTAVVTLTAWIVLPLLWGWQAYTVTSGSMSPLLRRGDVVIAAPGGEARVRSIVVIAPAVPGGTPVTHRVVERLPNGLLRTRGDANASPDSRLITERQLVGGVRVVIPLAGLIRLHAGILLPLAAGTLLLIWITRRRGPHRNPGRPAIAVAAVAAVAVTTPGTGAAWTATTSTQANGWRSAYFYAAAVKASAPVSYWRMGGTSTTAVDDEMGRTQLQLYNTPAVGVPGALTVDPNTATRFTNGTGASYGSVTSTAYAISGPLTVAAWTDAVATSNWRLIFKGDSSVGTLNYLLSWSSDSGKSMRFLVDSGSTRYETSALWPTDGGYHFVCGVYDGSAIRLYLDGVQVASRAASGTLVTNTTALQISEKPSGTPLRGSVDEVAIWSRALPADKIADLYALGRQ